jgi:P27 family predicted phage terminase small subunit
MPPTVERDPVARGLWEDLTSLLIDQRVLSPVDGPVLVALVSSYSLLIQARQVLEQEGFMLENKRSGAIKAHPAIAVASAAARDLKAFSSEMGLSPTARARILHLEEKQEVDDMDDFLDSDDEA